MLAIGNLEVVYHGIVPALRRVSLSVSQGSVVSVLGRNGAGKTTLLRAITGLLPLHDGKVTNGWIRFEEQSLLGKKPDAIVRRGIAQVPEGRRVFPELTVEDNLLSGAYSRRAGVSREEVESLYDQFKEIGGRRGQLAGYLSGGEQQMLSIARAMICKPRLLVLDEPSMGLAPKIISQVGDHIRRIRDAGVSILLIEQNAAFALDVSDYGYVLETGSVVLSADSTRLRKDPEVQESYLGVGRQGSVTKSFRDVRGYRRRRTWLS